MKRSPALIACVVVLASALALGREVLDAHPDPASTPYRTTPVTSADLVATITASGTLVPEDVVDVGAQVNGRIASFGADDAGAPVDFRSGVTQGLVLARIDTALFDADVATAEAQLAQANAQVQRAAATEVQATAHREQTQHDWERVEQLGDSPALARADFDAARAAFEGAQAACTMAAAARVEAQAGVQSAQAALTRARHNLDYCTIRSPVDGVILDRRVEIGQTVVASLNAPSLFLIAKDLSRMTVLVQVNEADIARVQPGAPVSFTVDARPEALYHGTVRKVRLNATLTQNVVTYTVEVAAENPDLALLPYLTANVVFELARADGVLSVPNAALRWAPRGNGESEAGPPRKGALWTLKDGVPQRLAVEAGLSDGARTAVAGAGVVAGLEVIVGERDDDAVPAAAGSNPFAPQTQRGRR